MVSFEVDDPAVLAKMREKIAMMGIQLGDQVLYGHLQSLYGRLGTLSELGLLSDKTAYELYNEINVAHAARAAVFLGARTVR